MFFDETAAEAYDWEMDGVYILQEYDPVQGGPDGISNTQAKALALRTRNLHNRLVKQDEEIATLKQEIASLKQQNKSL